MHRVLTCLNLFGVCALAVLCGFQWQANGRATHAAEAAEQARVALATQLADQGRTLAAATADLDDARGRLSAAQALATEAQGRLKSATTERDVLLSQRDQYRTTVEKWSLAVADRDQALKTVAAERDDATARYNALVNRGNAVAKAAR